MNLPEKLARLSKCNQNAVNLLPSVLVGPWKSESGAKSLGTLADPLKITAQLDHLIDED